MLKKIIRLSLMDIYYVPILYLILFPTHILHVHLIKNIITSIFMNILFFCSKWNRPRETNSLSRALKTHHHHRNGNRPSPTQNLKRVWKVIHIIAISVTNDMKKWQIKGCYGFIVLVVKCVTIANFWKYIHLLRSIIIKQRIHFEMQTKHLQWMSQMYIIWNNEKTPGMLCIITNKI